MKDSSTVPLKFVERPQDQMLESSRVFYRTMKGRRSVRNFSSRSVPREIIENCVKTAGTAPSGANCQPWYFVVVGEAKIKKQIRLEAEKVEQRFYSKDTNKQWVDDLEQLGTSVDKPFLEQAPYLIAVFSRIYDISPQGTKIKHYYVNRSVGIAVGFLVAAIHNAGLACLTYTASPMDFVNEILDQPAHHRPFCLLPVGYPAENATVPSIEKKSLDEIVAFL